MMLMMLMVSSVFLLGIMTSLNQPLFMAFMLGSLAIGVSLTLGVQMSSLLGYFVFLIYIGGIMVLLGYVFSIFPNQRFSGAVLPFKFFGGFMLIVVSFNLNAPALCKDKINGDIMSYISSTLVYVVIGLVLLYALLLVVLMCDKGRLPLRQSEF